MQVAMAGYWRWNHIVWQLSADSVRPLGKEEEHARRRTGSMVVDLWAYETRERASEIIPFMP
jgi:hypothetical protein